MHGRESYDYCVYMRVCGNIANRCLEYKPMLDCCWPRSEQDSDDHVEDQITKYIFGKFLIHYIIFLN